MTANGYGVIAVTNLLLCMLITVFLFPIAAWAGFNATTTGIFLALLASAAASFYLLAKRRELTPRARQWTAAVVLATLLLAISPLLVAAAYVLRG